MTDTTGIVAWIAIAPVKSMALSFLSSALVGRDGIAGDRAFAVIDPTGRVVNGTRLGILATIRPTYDPATDHLELAFPDGTVIAGTVERAEPLEATFTGGTRPARVVIGPWDEALSGWAKAPVRLVAMGGGDGYDRGPTVTVLSTAALAELAAAGGSEDALDRRRFRMTFGIDGVPAYAEDRWIGRSVSFGAATVAIAGNVGRCAVTTQDPETGRPSWDTLRVLQQTRGALPTSERLPFGVWAEVEAPGLVAVGDAVALR
jgi:MOSC domain-containing protein